MGSRSTFSFSVIFFLGMFPCKVCMGDVGYEDFPLVLRTILDQRIGQLTDEDGVCLAGRVTKSDGSPILSAADAQVNIYDGVDVPTRMYEGGWFVMNRPLNSFYAKSPMTVIVRALGYEPLDESVTFLLGEISYLDFVIRPTAEDDLASVSGIVLDENGDPFGGARVSLNFPFANFGHNTSGYSYPHLESTTGGDGLFEFGGLSSTEHGIIATFAGYAYHYENVVPPVGSSVELPLQLFPNRRVHLRYAYQTNGSRNFSEAGGQYGMISWRNGDGGVDFSEGVVEGYEQNDLRDLELRQTRDVLEFDIVYATGNNGFYDAGAVDFDQVAEAAPSGYSSQNRRVLVGHVYVVRTYEENHYVKFIVESDESSFRTVVAGDPDPIIFAGYDLTADFRSVFQGGQLTVDRLIFEPMSIGYPALPFYWLLSGMSGIPFFVDVTFGYRDEDLIAIGIPERGLSLVRSVNQGSTWTIFPTIHDSEMNQLRAENLTSFGRFAIANTAPFVRGDADGDGDVDLRDFQSLQNCRSNTAGVIANTDCIIHLFDEDSDVDTLDTGSFIDCFVGPGFEPPTGCGS